VPDDCDDSESDVHPEAAERCLNNRDDDCDGVVDGCEAVLESNSLRLVDPDGAAVGGFGLSMGFLAGDGGATLWISPQWAVSDPRFLAASLDRWPATDVSGFEGSITGYTYEMIATGSDLDADGRDDLALSETDDDASRAYVFFDTEVDRAFDDADVVVTAPAYADAHEANTEPGVRALGDLNGDDHDDLLVSNTRNSWLVAGPVSGDLNVSDAGETRVPWSVDDVWSATSLDFDGDGIRDLATTDYMDDTGGDNAGAAFVYLAPGGPILEPMAADCAWYGTFGDLGPTGEGVGSQVEAGDFDGDGREDLAIRSAGTIREFATGIVYIVAADAPVTGELATTAHATIVGEAYDQIGQLQGAVADFDHDGRSDIAQGAPEGYPKDKGDGYVAVLLGPFEGELTTTADANLLLRGTNDSWVGGNIVDGDWDADGEIEIAVWSSVLDADDQRLAVVDIITPALISGF
jgi:hypothetical protein